VVCDGKHTTAIVGDKSLYYTHEPSRVSVLVSVGLGIQYVLVQPDAPILIAKSFRLQHSAAWCA
jgi:hypothetical protein